MRCETRDRRLHDVRQVQRRQVKRLQVLYFLTESEPPGFRAFGPRGSEHSSSFHLVGAWLSLVEHLVRDQGVGGSNPLAPTNFA